MIGERRRQGVKKAKRLARILQSCSGTLSVKGWYDENGPQMQRFIKTRVPCSCVGCGNERKWFGHKTRQELQNEDEARDQIEAWSLKQDDI